MCGRASARGIRTQPARRTRRHARGCVGRASARGQPCAASVAHARACGQGCSLLRTGAWYPGFRATARHLPACQAWLSPTALARPPPPTPYLSPPTPPMHPTPHPPATWHCSWWRRPRPRHTTAWPPTTRCALAAEHPERSCADDPKPVLSYPGHLGFALPWRLCALPASLTPHTRAPTAAHPPTWPVPAARRPAPFPLEHSRSNVAQHPNNPLTPRCVSPPPSAGPGRAGQHADAEGEPVGRGAAGAAGGRG